MKSSKIKLYVGTILLFAILVAITIPSFAKSLPPESKYYSFYNVSNGEDLDGKTFVIVGDYKSSRPGPQPKSVSNGKPEYSPCIGTDSDKYDGYTYILGGNVKYITDTVVKTTEGISYNLDFEWTFEKNNDGTYSLYKTNSDSTERTYMYCNGEDSSLQMVPHEKAKFIIEYQNDGRIALKYGGREDIMMGKGPSEDMYVSLRSSDYCFGMGTEDTNHILSLYSEKDAAGLICYDYDGNAMEFGEYDEYGNYPSMESTVQFIEGSSLESIYTVENKNKNDAYEVFKSTDIPYLSDLYAKKTADNESFKDPSPKSSKIWGREIVLAGWEAVTIEDNYVFVDANAQVRYDKTTDTIVTKDVGGNDVNLPVGTTLHAYYIIRSENVFFDIKYTELILNDGSLVTENVNTESLAVGHVYYPTKNNFSQAYRGPRRSPGGAYEDVLKLVRNFTESYDPSNSNLQIVVEGLMEIDPTTMARVSYTPATGKSLSDITDHTVDYIFKYSDELNVQDIENVNDYDIVWYGTSTQPIGVIASGVMRDVKNFLVIDAAFEDITVNEIPVEDFKIEILNEDGDVLKTLTLKDNNVEVSSDKKRYTWKLNDMTENTYTIKQYNRNVGTYTSNTNATTDVDTNVGNLTEDGDVVILKVSTVNNRKDQVRLVNKYEGKQEEKPQGSGNAPAPASQPSGGAPASGGPVAQAVQSIYNGLLPKTGSASAFIITVIGFVAIVLAIRLRNTKSKKKSKK